MHKINKDEQRDKTESSHALGDNALSAIKATFAATVANSTPITNINDSLFQSIEKAVKISRFVAGVVYCQPEAALTQIYWHSVHSSSDYSNRLSVQLNELLTNGGDLFSGLPLTLIDFRPECQSEVEIMKLLRVIRYQHSCAIAVLELSNALLIEDSTARMSILAERLTQAAYCWSYAYCRANFGAPVSVNTQTKRQNMLIVAMGKLGGNELNFSSDIDLIFFYLNDGETVADTECTKEPKNVRSVKAIENGKFFQKIGVLLIKLLDQPTQDGFVFRVDMRLRPYGDSGNLVMSVAQAEDYYHEQGRGWERFAMVRARIISGREDEVKRLENIITPFAFRRYIDYGVIDSLRNMKEMIQREVRRRGLKGNIKLGAGGIREIEFMVQSLQLIQGGRNKQLQQKNLLKVLPLLVSEKMLADPVATDLQNNYRFLRRLEHCIQELDEKQTQQLPEDDHTQQIVANLMGVDGWDSFSNQLENKLTNTHQHFNALFGEQRTYSDKHDEFYLSLWDGHISVSELSQKCGFDNVASTEVISILTNFKGSTILLNLSARGARRLALFFPILLETCLSKESPAQVLARLILILRSILRRTAYLDLLSENLPLLQHLVDLVSRSDWISKRLSECPILLDELLYPNALYQPLQAHDLWSELQQNLLRIDEDDEEQILDAIRQFKLINELRVAAALLSERLNISQVSRYLTQLAEVIIRAGVNHSWKKIVAKHGLPAGLDRSNPDHLSRLSADAVDTGFIVVGYGKLGSAELGFNSDLDLVFLFDRDLSLTTDGKKSINVSRFYTRLAQKLIHFLSTRTGLGVLYNVDMRLRPSGNSGLLVSHVGAFKVYQEERAWTWEHQALTRARAIAGGKKLINKFAQIRNSILSMIRDPEELAVDVLAMRNKMRINFDKSTAVNVDLKQCVGGLIDIEFLAQFLMLCENKTAVKKTPPTSTVGMLKHASQNGTITMKDTDLLVHCYCEYSNHLNEKAIVGENKLSPAALYSPELLQVEKIWNKILPAVNR